MEGYFSTNAFVVVSWKVTRFQANIEGLQHKYLCCFLENAKVFTQIQSVFHKYLCCFLENAKVCVPAPSSILQPPLLHSQKAFVLPACQTCPSTSAFFSNALTLICLISLYLSFRKNACTMTFLDISQTLERMQMPATDRGHTSILLATLCSRTDQIKSIPALNTNR